MVEPVHGDREQLRAAPSAPLSRRVVARLIDLGVGVLMLVGVMLAFAAIGHATGPPAERLDGTGIFLISVVVTFVLYLAYEVGLVALWGRTLGKVAVGLRVERLADGRRPGLLRSFLRNLIPTVTLVAFFPAFPLAWFVQSIGPHRSLGDRLAETRVVTSVRPHA